MEESKQFIVETGQMIIVPDVPEDVTEGTFAVVNSAEDLMDQFQKDDLVRLSTSIRGKSAEGDTKKSAKKLASEIWSRLIAPPKERKAVGVDENPGNPAPREYPLLRRRCPRFVKLFQSGRPSARPNSLN